MSHSFHVWDYIWLVLLRKQILSKWLQCHFISWYVILVCSNYDKGCAIPHRFLRIINCQSVFMLEFQTHPLPACALPVSVQGCRAAGRSGLLPRRLGRGAGDQLVLRCNRHETFQRIHRHGCCRSAVADCPEDLIQFGSVYFHWLDGSLLSRCWRL